MPMSVKQAFVFPGQGAQSVGMLAGLAEAYPLVGETFAEASEVLSYDLWDLVRNGPEVDLNQTDRTQPAMLASGVAVWRVWQAEGGSQPDFVAGHSLGEYSALVASGVLEFSDAVSLVQDRGRFMQEAVPAGEGAMAALLGLDDATVAEVCRDASAVGIVSPANFNSVGQVVIAGQTAAVNRAMELAKEAGAKRAVELPVSVPSHCALMKPAAERLAERFAEITWSTPSIPVLHNVDLSSHSSEAAIRDALIQQLSGSVRWVETIQKLAANGVQRVLELGPGKVLTGLSKRIDRKLPCLPVLDPETLAAALAAPADDG